MFDFLKLVFNFSHLSTYFGPDAVVYAVMALAGTAIFLLRLFITLVLGDLGIGDFDAGVELDHDGGAFGLFSILSVTAFFMGAGWAGLAARVDFGLAPLTAVICSAGFGGLMMLLASSLMFGLRQLAQEQTYDVKTAVGRTGQVYMSIPPRGQGSGQVRVSVSGRSKILTANSTGPAIAAFSEVVVVDSQDDGSLVVEPKYQDQAQPAPPAEDVSP